jgi:divalent metal cation (Fe/Co/Zn/Cd) transporter
MKEAINKILGEEPDADLVVEIQNEIHRAFDYDLQMHHFHIHNYISHQELTLHIRLNKDLTIGNGHKIATDIEKIIEDKFGMVATIHIEPLG